MLVICPECRGKVSDQAEVCVHCGFPIKKRMDIKINTNTCLIDGISRDLTEQINNIDNPQYQPLKQLVKEYNMSIRDASTLWMIIKKFKQIPSEYNSSQCEEYRKQLDEIEKSQQNIPKCPTCGSTNIEKISVTKKAFGGVMLGLFSSDIRNTMHCKNCGYKW